MHAEGWSDPTWGRSEGDARVRNRNQDGQRSLIGGFQTLYYNVLGNNQHHPSYVLAKNKHTESNDKEVSEKARLRNILQNNWPIPFNNVKVMEDKGS